ncbi:MAG: hypothetical protein HC806_04845 [Anaerolineae bacterium]|nr:hypothetical protein [Anaerolineae bacterium]
MLAGNRTVYQFGVELPFVEDPKSIAFAMQVVLGEDYERMYTLANPENNPDLLYVVLADYVPTEKTPIRSASG